jgi:hypothetical protein
MMVRRKVVEIQSAQIILGAMVLGMLAFAGVAIFVRPQMEPADPGLGRTLLITLIALAVGELAAYLVLRMSVIRRLRASLGGQAGGPELERMVAGQVLSLTIIGAAMLEGCGLFGIVIYLVSGATVGLLAPALAIGGMALLLPTRERNARFVARITDEQTLR